MNKYQEYEVFLKSLTDEELSAELQHQNNRENKYAGSQAAHDAALFFGMMSYASSDAWRVTACERELARRTPKEILKKRDEHPLPAVARAVEACEADLKELYLKRSKMNLPHPSPEEDELEDLIDSSFEYLCAQMGVREAEKLCRSLEQ